MIKFLFIPLALICFVISSGCAIIGSGKKLDDSVVKAYPVLSGMPVSENHTPYSPSLVCLAEQKSTYAKFNDIFKYTITVGHIRDLTGKYVMNGDGAKITQGAAGMAMSALFKTNAFVLVDRTYMNISNEERTLTEQRMISDYNKTNNQPILRKLYPGEIIGSNYRIVGAITELNNNISSVGNNSILSGLGAKTSTFVADVGMDLFLVDTRTTVIIDAVSVKKQIIGYETSRGVYRFFNNELFDVSLGVKKQEPMQLAVRSTIEYAIYEFTHKLYGKLPNICNELKRKADGI